jgi:hypothetical protein
MHKLSKLALLAVAGGLTVVTPSFAAPPMGGPKGPPPIDCSLPQNAKNPLCLNPGGNYRHGKGPNGPNGGPPPPPPPGSTNHDNGPGPNGFNFSQHDRDQFHRRFGPNFNFGFSFGLPSFSIQLGTVVPRAYGLRPVPRAIYRYYPQFRGYLFFTTRHGSVVIVSPRSHRIVAVL